MNGSFGIPEMLRTARLVLRPIGVADAPDVFAYCSDPAVTRFVSWPTHRSIEDAMDFVRRKVREAEAGPVLDWGISEGEESSIVGWIGIGDVSDEHLSGELGYVLARKCWGRGLMTEAVRMVIDAAFRHTPLNRIDARCMVANRASARVLEKSGMRFEGVLREVNYFKGTFVDLQSWAVLRRDWLEARGR
jgi:ribosomal-protein-alanine N-acetyltransferase